MKAVVQRVKHASVVVDNETTGEIQEGLLVLLGVHEDDSNEQMKWIADKLIKLRIFQDEEGKMNKSVNDIKGGILLVSQFTLYGNLKKGTRPSFIEAAGPEKAKQLYEDMLSYLKDNTHLKIQSGIFAAEMKVSLLNDGPVTIILER